MRSPWVPTGYCASVVRQFCWTEPDFRRLASTLHVQRSLVKLNSTYYVQLYCRINSFSFFKNQKIIFLYLQDLPISLWNIQLTVDFLLLMGLSNSDGMLLFLRKQNKAIISKRLLKTIIWSRCNQDCVDLRHMQHVICVYLYIIHTFNMIMFLSNLAS